MSLNVLVVSRDPMLLQTRQLILGAFFQVHGAGRVREAEELMSRFSFDLIVLCSTLSEAECRSVMDLAANRKQHPKILVVTPFGYEPEKAVRGCVSMAEAGPYYLLKKSAEMLGVDIRARANLVEV